MPDDTQPIPGGLLTQLRQRYPSGKTRARLNAAIREEIIGGHELLDAMELLHRLSAKLTRRSAASHAHQAHYAERLALTRTAAGTLGEIRNIMVGDLIARYHRQHDDPEA
jgi:hypothetical protein